MKRRAPWIGDGGAESPGRTIALLPLTAVSWLYGAGARLDRALGTRRARRLPIRVVSVGSVLAGGSGKTPTAAWIAAALHRRGWKVALASRGYGRRRRLLPVTPRSVRPARGPRPAAAPADDRIQVVSDGSFVLSRVENVGDEPMLLAAHAPGVPVLVGADRALVGLRALSAFGADVLILDDGFQHHRLARDVDVVTLDGEQGFGNRHLLPRGPLREPLSALRFADAIATIDGPVSERDRKLLVERAPGALRFSARRRAVALRPLRGGAAEVPQSLAGREVGLLAGLASPAPFRRTLESLGARVVAERALPDHHRYGARDLEGLAREAPLWITTEKDAVKILPSWARGVDLRVLSIDLDVDRPAELLDWLEGRLR